MPSNQAAATEPLPSPLVAELALAERRGAAAEAPGEVVVRIDGGLYGLHAADGAVLWRRFVGHDAAPPLVLDDGRAIAVDAQDHLLLAIEQASGKLQWRLPLEGGLATPVRAGAHLLIASDAGKLFVVDVEKGALVGHVQFNQPLHLPPAVNEAGDRIYVLGEHSNLYTLSAADFSCLGVHYLGHAAGDVLAPPLAVLNKLIVADNSGQETCRVRVLALDERGIIGGEIANHRLSGLVATPLPSAGRRFAAVTTLGEAVVFEISAANDKSALSVVASRDAQDREPMARFSLMHEGHLWLAGQQLIKLAILPTGNQLPVRSLERDYQGDAFDYPLQAAGGLIVHVRRPAGQAGAIVAAADAEAGRPTWETVLAVPPAGSPAVDEIGMRIVAGAASGAVYVVDRDAMSRRVQDQAERLPAPPGETPVFVDSLDLGQGRLVLGSRDAARLLHFRPGDPREPLTAVELPGPLSCPPIAWRDGFVAATTVGQVHLYNADTASHVASPFQPELTAGREFHWLRPAVFGSGDEAQLVVSDGVAKVFLVAYAAEPQPNLKAVASVDVGPSRLVTPLAVSGSRVFAGNEAGQLVSFSLPELTAGNPVEVGGRVAWGPYAAGDGLILATEAGELMVVGGDGAIRWRQPAKRGLPGGAPLVDGQNAFVLYPTDGIARVSLAEGAEAAFAALGQPAVAGPAAFGPRLVVSSPDGTLLIVKRPGE
jgi:outer membrane protein assembly factor BamB